MPTLMAGVIWDSSGPLAADADKHYAAVVQYTVRSESALHVRARLIHGGVPTDAH